jgi:hypothetical protein
VEIGSPCWRIVTREIEKSIASNRQDYQPKAKNTRCITGDLPELFGQPGEKYFDYFVFNIVGYGLPRSGARRRALAQTISNAWGLDINSSRSAEKSPSRPAISSTLANTAIPTAFGGSTTTLRPIVVVILRQQLDIVDYGRADHAAPDTS